MSQIWDKTTVPSHILHTAYPIRHIAWRPSHETELAVIPLCQPLAASCADSLPHTTPEESENAIEVWDVRREFIPKYALPTLDGLAMDVRWNGEGAMVACHENGGFGQLDIRNRSLPLESVPRQVMGWSVKGEMAYAIDRFKQGEIPFDDL
jgi:hypothetical protein